MKYLKTFESYSINKSRIYGVEILPKEALDELNDYVDYFILVEAVHTISGKQKQLFFNENKQNFEKYKNKININYKMNNNIL